MTPSLAGVILGVIRFYEFLILAYVIMSWFRPSGLFFEIFRVIGSVVEPYIGIFRRIMPATGMIDFSPLVAILVLQLATSYLIAPLLASL